MLILKSDEHNPFISSIHAHPFVQTPNLDRLAARGVVFENTYCPSPLCMPSRSSFVSGRRVHEIRTYSNCNILSYDYPTYGRVLADRGVHTVHVGKTDFYNVHSELGFSETILPQDRASGGDIHIRRNPLHIREGSRSRANGYGVEPENFRQDIACTDAAIEWLSTRGKEMGKPWTMDLNLVRPHFPHRTTQELWDLYAEHADLPHHGGDERSANHPYARDLRAHFETDFFTEEQTRGLRRGYYGCVSFIDQQLGRVLDALEETGLAENTVVAYTSDHGEMLGKFGMWWKCSLYEDSVRVPLVIAGPGFSSGTRTRTPVDLLDLQATLFRANGAERPEDWSGVPLQDIPENDPERLVFSEYHGHGTRASAYMVRKGDWKFIYNCEGPMQLFNLAKDPNELKNLHGAEPKTARFMALDLRTFCDPTKENERVEETIAKQIAAFEEAKG
jgi:choline-sulfatase